MQLQNFECQIAKAQIGRYVAGDILSDETMDQLEAHVAKCPECKQNLAERRAVLQAMLSHAEPEPIQKEEPVTRQKFDLATFIRSKAKSKQPVQAAVQTTEPKTASFTKPALYSLALGAVLIGMSYVSKNMDSVLGSKAAQTPVSTPVVTGPHTQTTPPQTTPAPKPEPKTATPPVIRKPATIPVVTPQTPPVSAKPKPQPGQPIAAPKTLATISHPVHHKTPRSSSNSIHIYAPEN